jgi:hypothetical protein
MGRTKYCEGWERLLQRGNSKWTLHTSENNQVWSIPKNTEVKQRTAGTSEETRKVMLKEKHRGKAQNIGTTENSHMGTAHILQEVLM